MKTSWYKMAALVAALMIFGISSAVAAPVSVTVQKAEGTVETRESASAVWVKAVSGEKLSAGASVKTGPTSSCILKWGDGHVLKLQALSILDISRIERDEAGNENTRLDLSVGKINAHVAKLTTRDSTFSVKTPTAIAGVRGTDLFVNVAEDNTSTFGVTDGEIFVEAGGIETVVMQDFVVTVNPAGEAAAPAPMPEEMKQESREQSNEIKQEAKTEKAPEDKGKEEDKKGTGEQDKGKGVEQGKGIEKQEEKAAAEDKEAGGKTETETAEAAPSTGEETMAAEEPVAAEEITEMELAPEDVADTTADAVDTITDNIMDEQLTNEIVEEAERAYKTGQFEIDIYVEP